METFKIPLIKKKKILALGAESAGRFCFYENGNIRISDNFGDLLDEYNFKKYESAVLKHIIKEKPDIILTDLHPLYRTTALGKELSAKLKIPHIQIQHHIAHIFSAAGDRIIRDTKYVIPNTFFGIASDGTGYGLDGNIWGGEVFKIKSQKSKCKITNKKSKYYKFHNLSVERIGSLEEQIMIGGDLAVREPARMIIGILAKITNHKSQITNNLQITNIKSQKNFIYSHVKKFYSRNEFELLYNQLQQNFNCQKTTSTGRILDAVSVFLSFAGNERNSKHEATKLLEYNSSTPYDDYDLRFTINNLRTVLDTTYLFEYLLNNMHKDKKRLAATAQLYLAHGFLQILESKRDTKYSIQDTYFAGGMANNKIISSYLSDRGVYFSKTIPRGDEGVAFGQIIYHLMAN